MSEVLRPPLRDQEEISVASDAEYAFFLQCFELYRVIDLADRTLEGMIEAYSKYRTRDLFKESFQVRQVEPTEGLLENVNPGAHAIIIGMFNLIHELRLSLLYEDALPFTVKARIEAVITELKKEWNSLQPVIEERHQWRFKLF